MDKSEKNIIFALINKSLLNEENEKAIDLFNVLIKKDAYNEKSYKEAINDIINNYLY